MENSKQTEKIISHLASFPELNPNPVLEIDYSGRISYCNFAAIKTLKEIGLKGKDIRGFVPKDLKRIIKSLRKNKRPLSYEVEIADKAFIGNISLSSEFKTAHIYLTDITERKYTEDALRREKDMVRRYLDIAGVIIVAIDASQKIRLINRKGCEILGVSQKEAIGRNWFNSFIPRKNRKETRAVFLKLISGKLAPVEYFENPVLTKSGEERIIAWHNNMLRDARGKIIATLSSGEDITERKRIEDALRESEARYRAIIEDQTELVTRYLPNGKVTFLNQASLNYFNLKGKDLIGKTFLPLIPKEDRKKIKQSLSHFTKNNPVVAFEHRVIDGKGRIRWQQWINRAIFDEKGKIVEIQGVGRDITEERQAQEDLRKAHDELELKVAQRTAELTEANKHILYRNEILKLIGTKFSRKEFLESVIEHLKIWSGCRCVGIRVLDAEGRIPYESYTGFSREFWESENWLSIKEDQCSCIRVIKGKPELQDMPVTSKGGSFYSNNTMKFMENLSEKESSRFRGVCVRTGFLSVAVIPISYKNKIIGVIHLADEREGRVQLKTVELMEFLALLIGDGINKFNLENRIKQGHSILDASFKHTINPFVFLDTGLNFIRVNEAYARACRRDVSEFPGHNLFEFYPNEANERIFRQVVRTKAPFQAFAKPLTFSDHPEWGVTYWDWTLVPILDNKRMVEFLVFSLNDVTKRKLAEEKLSQTQKELDSAKRLWDIGILAATVAHELRNPLGVIRTAAYNIKRKAQNPALESHLINIEKKILEADQIINNLLFYSRLKSPHYESVRIYDILNECVKSTIIRFNEHNVAVIKKINSLRKVFIDADPLQMSELINNILNNANDACMGRNCKIEVRAVKDGKGNVEIAFRDYGVGIDEENLKKIFEPFFTTKAKGTGLGLTVCNQIVNLHGGKICIDSKKGRGTTVTVTVPIKRKINSKENLND